MSSEPATTANAASRSSSRPGVSSGSRNTAASVTTPRMPAHDTIVPACQLQATSRMRRGPYRYAATAVSTRYGLLTGDALLVAVMQHHGLTHLASHDADFDRVPGISRYAPV